MKPIVYRSEMNVRFAELDPYGHVNSTHYLDYIISSRFEFLEKRFGLKTQDFVEKATGFYVSRIEMHFKRPIQGMQRIAIISQANEIADSKVLASFQICSADDAIRYTIGTLDIAIINLTTNRPITCPDWVQALLFEGDSEKT